MIKEDKDTFHHYRNISISFENPCSPCSCYFVKIDSCLALRDIEAEKLQAEPHHDHKEDSNFFNQKEVECAAKVGP